MTDKRLKKVFEDYKRKTGQSITATSKKIGWSTSKLGLFLTGARKISVEDAIVAANFFNVDPREIKPDCVMPQVLRIKVDHVVSGATPLSKYRDFPVPNLRRFSIYVDEPLKFEAGDDVVASEFKENNFVSQNCFITCNHPNEPIPQSTTWPATLAPSWILKKDNKMRLIKNMGKPKRRGWKVIGYIVAIRYF